jgi:hypothetical protein
MLIFLSVAVLIGLAGFGSYWFYRSFANFVDANEMGVPVIFGNADHVCEGGSCWIFVPWLPKACKCYLKIYPTRMYNLEYDPIKVMSKEGDYPKGGKHHISVEVVVVSRAYLNFPREREMLVNKETDEPVCFLKDLMPQERNELKVHEEVVRLGVTLVWERTHPLIEIVRAGVPTTKAELQDWSEKGMTSAVRSAGAQMTWKEANENPVAFKDMVEKSYLKVDGALIQAGFRPSGIKLAIKLVDPPQQLKDALAGEASASHVAKREAVEVGDSLSEMVDKQIAAMEKRHPMTKEDYLKVRQECLNQLTRDRTMQGGGKLIDIRVASADGTPFAQGSISEIIAGIVAAVAASSASKDQGSDGQGKLGGFYGGGPQGGKKKEVSDMTEEEKEEEFKDI